MYVKIYQANQTPETELEKQIATNIYYCVMYSTQKQKYCKF